jgi:hypothetical protein
MKLVEYQGIGYHMIFDIKMDGNLTQKARLVAGGHTTEMPTSATYSSVVSRESVRLAFTIIAGGCGLVLHVQLLYVLTGLLGSTGKPRAQFSF